MECCRKESGSRGNSSHRGRREADRRQLSACPENLEATALECFGRCDSGASKHGRSQKENRNHQWQRHRSLSIDRVRPVYDWRVRLQSQAGDLSTLWAFRKAHRKIHAGQSIFPAKAKDRSGANRDEPFSWPARNHSGVLKNASASLCRTRRSKCVQLAADHRPTGAELDVHKPPKCYQACSMSGTFSVAAMCDRTDTSVTSPTDRTRAKPIPSAFRSASSA